MKQFDWVKIAPKNIEKTIWKNLDDTHVPLELEEFEEFFCAAPIVKRM